MNVLVVYNQYQQPGGEDIAVASESELLRRHGHVVVEYRRDNNDIKSYGLLKKASLYFTATWAKRSFREIKELCKNHKPDVAHFHNTTPLISPSAYYACKEEGVPVVQTLHNYRLLCPGTLLMRNGVACEECILRDFQPALKHKCYRNSYFATLALVRMLRKHRSLGTYDKVVDRYIALSEFSRKKFVEGGLPEDKVSVKPNFVLDPPEPRFEGEYAVYVGRLSGEKGIYVLLEAWKKESQIPLVVVGSSDLAKKLPSTAPPSARFAGEVPHEKAIQIILGAKFLVLPSLCFEGFPLALVEAFACGKPVVASRLGALEEIVKDGETGLLFEPGDANDLAAKVNKLTEDPALVVQMGRNAWLEFKRSYSAEVNYEQLVKIYSSVANAPVEQRNRLT